MWADELEILLKAYAIGQDYGVVDFQDAVMDGMIGIFLRNTGDGLFTPEDILPVFLKRCGPDPKGRLLAMHWLVHACMKSYTDDPNRFVDAEFARQVGVAFLKHKWVDPGTQLERERSKPLTYGQHPCAYHVHTDLGLACYKDSKGKTEGEDETQSMYSTDFEGLNHQHDEVSHGPAEGLSCQW